MLGRVLEMPDLRSWGYLRRDKSIMCQVLEKVWKEVYVGAW